ncbi:DUF6892 domain-containing protein [Tardiphaga sp. 839_C3_N1_4]|uniref:DUF6892 domain-containing protein n=1 Tax=Tardiphaga sp. 839_C3_N1_4 TaxID=3240761 RepID=UPI003F1FB638
MPSHTVDIEALAQLRPGMPVSRLSQALGAHWRPLTPGDEGWVRPARDVVGGFSARVDIHGVIRHLNIHAAFPKPAMGDQLQLGMTLQAAKAEYPSLAFVQDIAGVSQTLQLYGASAADGMQLTALFRDERLLGLQLFYPDAIYVAEMPALVPPDLPAGAPFADPNFKLVVLDALLEVGLIDLGSASQFLSQVLGRPFDPRDDSQWPHKCQPAYDYLVRIPLTPDQLSAVTALCFDAGNAIYDYIWPGWSGETADFYVRSLEGIEQLTHLRDFNDIALLEANDLSPLSLLPDLRSLDLGSGTKLPAATLLSLPALERFACYENDAPDRVALEALKAKGVKVHLH